MYTSALNQLLGHFPNRTDATNRHSLTKKRLNSWVCANVPDTFILKLTGAMKHNDKHCPSACRTLFIYTPTLQTPTLIGNARQGIATHYYKHARRTRHPDATMAASSAGRAGSVSGRSGGADEGGAGGAAPRPCAAECLLIGTEAG